MAKGSLSDLFSSSGGGAELLQLLPYLVPEYEEPQMPSGMGSAYAMGYQEGYGGGDTFGRGLNQILSTLAKTGAIYGKYAEGAPERELTRQGRAISGALAKYPEGQYPELERAKYEDIRRQLGILKGTLPELPKRKYTAKELAKLGAYPKSVTDIGDVSYGFTTPNQQQAITQSQAREQKQQEQEVLRERILRSLDKLGGIAGMRERVTPRGAEVWKQRVGIPTGEELLRTAELKGGKQLAVPSWMKRQKTGEPDIDLPINERNLLKMVNDAVKDMELQTGQWNEISNKPVNMGLHMQRVVEYLRRIKENIKTQRKNQITESAKTSPNVSTKGNLRRDYSSLWR